MYSQHSTDLMMRKNDVRTISTIWYERSICSQWQVLSWQHWNYFTVACYTWFEFSMRFWIEFSVNCSIEEKPLLLRCNTKFHKQIALFEVLYKPLIIGFIHNSWVFRIVWNESYAFEGVFLCHWKNHSWKSEAFVYGDWWCFSLHSFSATAPATLLEAFRYDGAEVSPHVTSQTKRFPFCQKVWASCHRGVYPYIQYPTSPIAEFPLLCKLSYLGHLRTFFWKI